MIPASEALSPSRMTSSRSPVSSPSESQSGAGVALLPRAFYEPLAGRVLCRRRPTRKRKGGPGGAAQRLHIRRGAAAERIAGGLVAVTGRLR
jgi:hypothetical protein